MESDLSKNMGHLYRQHFACICRFTAIKGRSLRNKLFQKASLIPDIVTPAFSSEPRCIMTLY